MDVKRIQLGVMRNRNRGSLPLFQEWVGKCFPYAWPPAHGFLICGMPKSGKSRIANLIQQIWPGSRVAERRVRRVDALSRGVSLLLEPEHIAGYDAIFFTRNTLDGVVVRLLKSRWCDVQRTKELTLPWR